MLEPLRSLFNALSLEVAEYEILHVSTLCSDARLVSLASPAPGLMAVSQGGHSPAFVCRLSLSPCPLMT